MQCLPNYILFLILQIISYRPIDVLRLKPVSFFFKQTINSLVEKNLRNHFGLKSIVRFLNSESILSGSYLLQILLSEYYLTTDLNVFCTKAEFGKIKMSFLNKDCQYIDNDTILNRNNCHYDENYLQIFEGKRELLEYLSIDILNVALIKISQGIPMINLICVNDPISFILNNADLDIVRNIWFPSSYLSGLKIKSLNHLEKKIIVLNFLIGTGSFNRIFKFERRGFKLVC